MKYCSQCGHANEDDALFCVKDGCKLEEPVDGIQEDKSKKQICTKCGFENESNIKFCGGCGKPLDINVQTKKAKRISFSKFVIVVSFILVMIVGFYLAKNTYDKDFSDLFDDFIELFEEEKEYHFNVNMHHSSEIDMDGETVNFSVDTDAEWFDVKNLEIRVTEGAVTWEGTNGTSFPYYASLGFDWNEDFALKPILNVEFVDNRNFRIIVNENRGYNRVFTVLIGINNEERNIYRRLGEELKQRGHKGLVKIK